MDPQTSKAYRFVRSQSQIDSTLDELFEPEVGEWIRRELLSVSQKPPLPAEASACGRCFRGPDFWVSQEDHDPRGTPEYVQRYCCPVSERALCDQEHQLHPNIQQQITTGQVGLANGNRNNLDPAKTAPKTNASADDDVYDDLCKDVEGFFINCPPWDTHRTQQLSLTVQGSLQNIPYHTIPPHWN